jgi:hypothetical protein
MCSGKLVAPCPQCRCSALAIDGLVRDPQTDTVGAFWSRIGTVRRRVLVWDIACASDRMARWTYSYVPPAHRSCVLHGAGRRVLAVARRPGIPAMFEVHLGVGCWDEAHLLQPVRGVRSGPTKAILSATSSNHAQLFMVRLDGVTIESPCAQKSITAGSATCVLRNADPASSRRARLQPGAAR